MGYLKASEMNRLADLDAALSWHLTVNHYPPVPQSMVGPCRRAVRFARKGAWGRPVRLPKGCTYRGRRVAPAAALIKAMHLDAFVEEVNYEIGTD